MKVTFLGTGTSQGVPLIGCNCEVCISDDKRNNRLRSSLMIETDGVQFVIDTGPDFRYQMLRSNTRHLDSILFTHSHKDHIAGLDDVRAFNYFSQKPIDVFATIETQHALRREYAYIFENPNYPGIPQIHLNTIQDYETFDMFGVTITPIKVRHYQMEVLGFRIKDFTYITDANFIEEKELKKIKGSKAFVLNALRHEKHISHFTLSEAIEIAEKINPTQTYFTHISHQLGLHDVIDASLPKGMNLAYDGLILSL